MTCNSQKVMMSHISRSGTSSTLGSISLQLNVFNDEVSYLFISRYDSSTGVFTVPPGGDGVYYFSVYLLVPDGESAFIDMMLNGEVICSTYPDNNNAGADHAPASYSAVLDVVAGNV